MNWTAYQAHFDCQDDLQAAPRRPQQVSSDKKENAVTKLHFAVN